MLDSSDELIFHNLLGEARIVQGHINRLQLFLFCFGLCLSFSSLLIFSHLGLRLFDRIFLQFLLLSEDDREIKTLINESSFDTGEALLHFINLGMLMISEQLLHKEGEIHHLLIVYLGVRVRILLLLVISLW